MKRLLIAVPFLINTTLYAQVGDCPAQYMCAGSALTAVVDVTDELNGTNNGCLSVNEGTTSYWIQICAQTAGTIQFTIMPAGNNNDYDWAVWNGSVCPPTVMPIRCSFAASAGGPGNDNTGVSSINNAPQTDNSEGAFGNQWVQDIVASAGSCYTICINNYGAGSNNFNISFGGTSILECSPLPIELVDFHCETKSDNITIYWATATETNNDEFQLWRSIDGINWIKLVTKPGAGNSSTPIMYWFSDFLPPTGTYYYRLIQKDYNGVETVSDITSCSYTAGTGVTVTYYNTLGQVVKIEEAAAGFYIKEYLSGINIRREVYYKK